VSVGRLTARAAVWAFLATAGSRVITLIGLILLARLLAPAEFGLIAVALVYITYAETIGDLGTGMALVYWPDRRHDAAQVTFIINLVAGVLWCLLTLLLAPLVADFSNAPASTAVIQILGISFIVRYLGNTHDALAQKDLRFRARMIPEVALALLKAVVALTLAWAGFGAWSLVWGHLSGLIARTVLLWIIVPWRPTLTFPRDLFGPMLRYGRGIIAVNMIAAVAHHADLVIVARYFNTTALGLYQMATKIPETTVIVLLWVVSRVLFPAFSRIHAAGESLRTPYLTATRYVASLTLPAATGLMLLADPIVRVFFGEQWMPAAPILGVLAVHAAARCVGSSGGDVLKATGRAGLLARLALLKVSIIVPALLFGATRGLLAVAVALACAELVATAIALTLATRILKVRLLTFLRVLIPSAAACGLMAITLLLFRHWINDLIPVAELAIGVVIGGLVYGAALATLDRELIGRVRRHFSPTAT
jgi:O-antigen/teichoic acid export membrane protein